MSEIIEARITGLGAQGDGLAEYEGTPLFVPGAAPGDLVTVALSEKRKNGLYGDLIEITDASGDRVEPPCRHFEKCGGCQLQFLSDDIYRAWLKERAEMALAHHGFDADLVAEPIVSPTSSRRRVALKAVSMPGRLILGFSERQSHKLVDLKECPVTHPDILAVIKPLRPLLLNTLKMRMSAEVHLTLTETGLDILVDAPMELDLAAREAWTDFANTYDIAAIHWRDQGFLDPVLIRREPMMNFSGTRAPLAPAAFVQATKEGEQALVREVVEACMGYKRVADLFCGMGTFTFPLAKHHQVLAVEGAKQPLDALRLGSNQATGLKQIIAKHRDLFRRPLTPKELAGFDAVVFDPPRAGAKEQVAELAKSEVKRIVAVSCNPNTFSRDARILSDGGYQLERVVPVDQFLWSPHLELVGVFSRP
jgi:23S rRNA (uracil1939-C5)-methyltransferase